MYTIRYALASSGEVAERLNALVLKTSKGASPSRVRIPPSPPLLFYNHKLRGISDYTYPKTYPKFLTAEHIFSTCSQFPINKSFWLKSRMLQPHPRGTPHFLRNTMPSYVYYFAHSILFFWASACNDSY